MKKIFVYVLVCIMLLSFTACGSTNSTEDATTKATNYYQVGEKVSTDIVDFTLDDAALAIALNNIVRDSDGTSDQFLTVQEYDPQKSDNGIAAAKGTTLISITMTIKNTDRASIDFFDSSVSINYYPTLSVNYKGIDYPIYHTGRYGDDEKNMHVGIYKSEATHNKWIGVSSSNSLIGAGEEESYRAYCYIKTDVDSLDDEFVLSITLPTSSGTDETFNYIVNKK